MIQWLMMHLCAVQTIKPQINPLSTELYVSDLKTQFVPRSKHSASVIKTDNLMLYREKQSLFVLRPTQNT